MSFLKDIQQKLQDGQMKFDLNLKDTESKVSNSNTGATPSTSDLIFKVSVGKYDQVFALTQQMINIGFANLWEKYARAAATQKVTVKSRGAGQMTDVLFDAPQIIISADPMNYSQVAYRLWFLEGRLQVFKSDEDGEDEKTDFDMAGWYFTFMVNIGMANLTPGSADYDKINTIVNAPGDHSITRLLVDMNTAQIQTYRKDLSNFNSQTLTDVEQRNFAFLISATSEKLGDQFVKTLGYQVQMETISDSSKATYLPTDVKFQTYPWTSPSNQTGKAGDSGTSNLNYLCYLETTANIEGHAKVPPSGSDMTLPILGNWTDGIPGQNNNFDKLSLGSFVQSRANFFEGWFLNKLRVLNRNTEAYMSDLTVHCTSHHAGITFTWDWDVNLIIGGNPTHQSADDPYYDFKNIGPSKYQFSSNFSFDQNAGFGTVRLWGSVNCNTLNTLEYQPGTSRITVTGHSLVHFYKSLRNVKTSDDTLEYTCDWIIYFDLQAVKDGGLQIVATIEDPVFKANNKKADTDFDNLQTFVEQSYQIAMKNFSALEATLVNDIGKANQFVFPAGGVFFFKNPVITHDGDIACEISYNGVPEQIHAPNQTAAGRASVSVVPDQPLPTKPLPLSGSG